MKKYKFLSLFLSLFMCLSIFTLTACSGGGLGGINNDELGDLGDESNTEDPPNINTSDYIQGVTILYRPEVDSEGDAFVDGFTGETVKFNKLIDRQLSMLADDILNRLNGIYGTGYTEPPIILLKDNNNSAVYFGSTLLGITASYNQKNAIAKYDDSTSVGGYLYKDGTKVDGSLYDLTQAASWAYVANISSGTFDYSQVDGATLLNKNFGLKGSITGNYTSVKSREVENDYKFEGFNTTGTTWNWSSSDITGNQFRDSLRMLLSVALSTGEYDASAQYVTNPTSYMLDQTEYQRNISNISHIGLLSYDKEVIKSLIKNAIIGKDVLDIEEAAEQALAGKNLLTNFTDIEPNTDTLKGMSQDQLAELDKMHLYKGYNVIVDSIVEQIASNTFSALGSGLDLNTPPIYPQMPRVATTYLEWDEIEAYSQQSEDGDFSNTYQTPENLDILSVIIMPKARMRLNCGIFYFESLNESNDYTVNISLTFVAGGEKTDSSKSVTVKVGVNGQQLDPDDASQGIIDNSFEVVNDDFEEFNTGNQDEYGGYVYECPIWNAYDGIADGDISTINNPFEMEQENGVSTSIHFNGGNNYLEMSFSFFVDAGMQQAFNGMPKYRFGFMDFDFEYENLDD